YFLDANKTQALGERRVGLGVMGLHDLLIYCETAYGSQEGNELVDKIFETIALTAYRTSIEIDRKSTRLNSSHVSISYAVFCLKKKNNDQPHLGRTSHAHYDLQTP